MNYTVEEVEKQLQLLESIKVMPNAILQTLMSSLVQGFKLDPEMVERAVGDTLDGTGFDIPAYFDFLRDYVIAFGIASDDLPTFYDAVDSIED